MVGLSTNPDDVVLLVGLVIFAPFLLVFGIAILLSVIGAKWWIVLIVSLANIGGAIYLLQRWELLDALYETVRNYLNP